MWSIKEINIKNQTYDFFDDMIHIKNFDSNLKWKMKDFDYVNIHSVNTLYLIIDREYIKEKMEINT